MPTWLCPGIDRHWCGRSKDLITDPLCPMHIAMVRDDMPTEMGEIVEHNHTFMDETGDVEHVKTFEYVPPKLPKRRSDRINKK